MDIHKLVEEFTGSSYDTKRNKVIDMLKQLSPTHETFAMFYKTIISLHNVQENVLIYLYQSILEIAEELAAGRKDEAQDKIIRMTEILMEIRKQEEIDKVREGNPEDILKKI